jgi:hypothetical protein
METLTLQIPSSWKDIKLGQYQEYIQYIQQNPNDKPYKMILNLLSILTDTDIEMFCRMPMNTIHELHQNIKFMEEEPTARFKNIIEIDGVRYGFQKDMHKLTLGEWIDIEHYIVNSDIIDNLHYITAILYRKVVKEGDEYFDYEIEPYTDIQLEGRAKLFKYNANIEDIYGIALFFYLIVSELWNNIISYSPTMTMEEKVMMIMERTQDIEAKKKLKELHEKSLSKSLTGNSYSTNLVEEILLNMIEY